LTGRRWAHASDHEPTPADNTPKKGARSPRLGQAPDQTVVVGKAGFEPATSASRTKPGRIRVDAHGPLGSCWMLRCRTMPPTSSAFWAQRAWRPFGASQGAAPRRLQRV